MLKTMHKNNMFLCSILLVQFLYSCKTSKEIYYSYKVDSYTIDTVKRLFASSSLISYGDYLFEFKKRTNIREVLHGETGAITSSTDYDTTGVYLLSNTDGMYYQFDTFALKNEISKTGKLADKEFGVRLTSPNNHDTTETVMYKTIPLDTIINNIKCFYVDIVSKNKSANDSINQRVILIKSAGFNSVYRINGAKFIDNDYCIVGVYFYNLNQKQGFLEELDSLLPLSDKEKNICESMVKKTKL